MDDQSAAASSTSGSPRDTAGSGSDRGATTSQSDLLGAKREGSDEPDDERDQLEEDDGKAQADSDQPRATSSAPVVEALVALHSTGAKNANAQFVHKLFA